MPIYPVPRDEGMEQQMPQEQEPLLGPAEASSNAKNRGSFADATGHAFDGTDAFQPKPTHHEAPLVRADYGGDAAFSKGTKDALDPGGLVS